MGPPLWGEGWGINEGFRGGGEAGAAASWAPTCSVFRTSSAKVPSGRFRKRGLVVSPQFPPTRWRATQSPLPAQIKPRGHWEDRLLPCAGLWQAGKASADSGGPQSTAHTLQPGAFCLQAPLSGRWGKSPDSPPPGASSPASWKGAREGEREGGWVGTPGPALSECSSRAEPRRLLLRGRNRPVVQLGKPSAAGVVSHSWGGW